MTFDAKAFADRAIGLYRQQIQEEYGLPETQPELEGMDEWEEQKHDLICSKQKA